MNTTVEPKKGESHDEHGQSLTVTIVNEDNGRTFDLQAGPGTPLTTLFERMYVKLGVTRQADDRLCCESNGQDLFASGNLKLREFVDSGHCPDLVWLFAGGTGGAARC